MSDDKGSAEKEKEPVEEVQNDETTKEEAPKEAEETVEKTEEKVEEKTEEKVEEKVDENVEEKPAAPAEVVKDPKEILLNYLKNIKPQSP